MFGVKKKYLVYQGMTLFKAIRRSHQTSAKLGAGPLALILFGGKRPSNR